MTHNSARFGKYLVALSLAAVSALGACSGTHQTASGIPKVGSSRDLAYPAPQPTGTWSIDASITTRTGNLGVGVAHKTLYAVGGWNDDDRWLNKVQVYNFFQNRWSFQAPMPTARAYLAVGVVHNILYAVGSYNDAGPLATVEAYDPVANAWTTKEPMPQACKAPAAAVINDILYVVGGWNGHALQTVEACDPSTNTWTARAPMPTARSGLTAGWRFRH